MNKTARLFCCNYCKCQVIICTRCDRSNIYCKKCAPLARGKSQRKASKNYQKTRQGKINHAKRQQRYSLLRHQKNEKMTHHPSNNLPLYDLLPIIKSIPVIVENISLTNTKQAVICSFCNYLCSNFLRINFLRYLSNK
jgi:hypothetical protein